MTTSERLAKVFEAGSVVPLFALLKDWPESELKELKKDLDVYYLEQCEAADEAYKRAVFEPAIFLSRKASDALDTAHMEAQQELLMKVAEILSVVFHYLPGDDEEVLV